MKKIIVASEYRDKRGVYTDTAISVYKKASSFMKKIIAEYGDTISVDGLSAIVHSSVNSETCFAVAMNSVGCGGAA